MIRPIPGPWRLQPPFRSSYVDIGDEVAWVAMCDRGEHDATWTRTRDAKRPTCTCPCQPEESVA